MKRLFGALAVLGLAACGYINPDQCRKATDAVAFANAECARLCGDDGSCDAAELLDRTSCENGVNAAIILAETACAFLPPVDAPAR